MRPELVRFRSDPRAFHVEVIRCHALDCECTEVAFNFREAGHDVQVEAKPLKFSVRMEGMTWQEIDPPCRPPHIALMVEEFLRDYAPAEREAIRTFCEEKLRGARRLKEYRIDRKSVTNGLLVPFAKILYGRPSGRASPESWFDVFDHEGEQYLVDDLYCANPECHCEKAHLAFFRNAARDEPDGAPVAADFLAMLSFDGRAEIEERHACTPRRAKAILAAWQKRYGSDFEELRWRYEKVKEIARRSVPQPVVVQRRTGPFWPDGHPTASPSSIDAPIGRNELCPCGSGKKFKKCCGHAKSGEKPLWSPAADTRERL